MARTATFSDWKAEFCPIYRQRNINKIADSLIRHLHVSSPEGLNELKKIAIRFEGKIYDVASSQTDYVQRITLKMRTMEEKIQSSASGNQAMSNVGAARQNGVPVHHPVTVSCLDSLNKRQHVPANKSITDCESYSNALDDPSSKRRRWSEPAEPAFSCPICMHTIVSLWSTTCGHVFCEDCIKVAVRNQKKCPACRGGLSMETGIHRVFLPSAE